MENSKDYEKLLSERLEDAYMREDFAPVMSREEFHRLIQAVEKKKRAKRTLMSLAVACVALCLVWGGFMAGMTMRESASAGKDDESKTMQQGDSVVIGSGVSEDDENVGVSTKTYTNIDDIPVDIRNEIRFLDSDEFELEKVKVVKNKEGLVITIYYDSGINKIIIQEAGGFSKSQSLHILKENNQEWNIGEITIYERNYDDACSIYSFDYMDIAFAIIVEKTVSKEKVEAIMYGLIS